MAKYKKDSEIDNFQEARKKRLAVWELKQKDLQKKENTREEFRKFFIKIKNKLSLEKEMEKVLWIHFKSAGFDKKEKFEAGIKHFGYNLK